MVQQLFFTLLANKKFPAACFIRSEEDFTYIKEPDIFHEFYGHLPMLTNQAFADFGEAYGNFALTCDRKYFKYLFRLSWFTVEFGLIETEEGDRIYGGGILSSPGETKSALGNPNVEYVDFDVLKALVEKAAELGDLEPMFKPVDGKGDILEYTN